MAIVFLPEKFSLLRVYGPDAPRYMNARLTYKCPDLEIGHVAQAGALSAQGKCESLFTIQRRGDEEFVLFSFAQSGAEAKEVFSRFIVADRVHVESISENAVAVCLADSSQHMEEGSCLWAAPLGAKGGVFSVLVLKQEALASFLGEVSATKVCEKQWHNTLVSQAIPTFGREIDARAVFTAYGLTGAVSLGKGCYTGQEVIEKIDAVGRTPRKLVWIKGDILLSPGASVFLSPGTLKTGEVLSSVRGEGGDAATFALLKNTPQTLPESLVYNEAGQEIGKIVQDRFTSYW